MVMPMVVCPNRFKLRRSGTAIRRLTAGRFKLNGRVSDMEAIPQSTINTRQNAAALGHRHLGDRDMTGESMRLGAKTPDMQVVNVEHAFD